jgi:hypothetical protein
VPGPRRSSVGSRSGGAGGITGVPGSRRPSVGPKPGARGGAMGVPGSFRPGREPKPGARGGAMGVPGSFRPGRDPKPGARGGAMGAPGSFLAGRDPKPGARGGSIGRPGSFFAGLLWKPGARGGSIFLSPGMRRPCCCDGAMSGRGGADGSPGFRWFGITDGSILLGLTGSDGSFFPGTTSGRGPSGPGFGGAAGVGVVSGGVIGTGGASCANAGAESRTAAGRVVHAATRMQVFIGVRNMDRGPPCVCLVHLPSVNNNLRMNRRSLAGIRSRSWEFVEPPNPPPLLRARVCRPMLAQPKQDGKPDSEA